MKPQKCFTNPLAKPILDDKMPTIQPTNKPIMTLRTHRADALLLLVAGIWGTTFVAQRAGMDHIGPYAFNAARFSLGALLLLPLAAMRPRIAPFFHALKAGAALGVILFGAASFQQMGIVYTTAGKTGFITGLYVIIVPFLGYFAGLHIARRVWTGALLATAGLYLLSIRETWAFAPGDFLVFVGAFLWAAHILAIGRVAAKHDVFHLAAIQFAICGLCSLIAMPFVETVALADFRRAAFPIAYSGLFSIGLGFTLQIRAQRHAPETHAAIILSLESVFAALAGWLVLSESLTLHELIGCVLMFAGMIIAQLFSQK